MTRYVVDRFEGNEWAVLEDERGRTFTVPRNWLPSGGREGDVLRASDQDAGAEARSIKFELDSAAREQQLGKARELRDRLPRAPKEDVSL